MLLVGVMFSGDLGWDTSCYVSVLVPRTPKIVTPSFYQLTVGKSDLSYCRSST